MTPMVIRPATEQDVPAIVAMLADDPLGAIRENPAELGAYLEAFGRIAADPHQHLVIATRGGQPAGTLQLTIVQGMSRAGMSRAIIEAVRVHRDLRGHGLGTELIKWAIERSRELGAGIVQLTSDASRTDAHRFYENLGFTSSHIGFKMPLR